MVTWSDEKWAGEVLAAMENFAERYSLIYSKKKRELEAYFEIGCFLALVRFYEDSGCSAVAENLADEGEYRYLTTPAGNPANFSFVMLTSKDEAFQIRQQVRIQSHLNPNIAFTPDLVVIPSSVSLSSRRDDDYYSGRREFFFVTSEGVISAHECKSLDPFPELLVSFIGMLMVGHSWASAGNLSTLLGKNHLHLAPTLFVGGTARNLHIRMLNGLMQVYPMNVISGMHYGTWDLTRNDGHLNRIRNPVLPNPGTRKRLSRPGRKLAVSK